MSGESLAKPVPGPDKPPAETESVVGIEEETVEESYIPDGGLSWIVTLCGFLANVVIDGVLYSTNDADLRKRIIWQGGYRCNGNDTVLRYDKETDIDELHCNEDAQTPLITEASYSAISSTILGVYLCSGPFVAALCNKFGYQIVAFAGAILAAAGIFLALVTWPYPNIYALIICYGVITGLGFGMMYTPSIVIVGLHFKRWRALATGIVCSGTGVGQFSFPYMIKPIIKGGHWWMWVYIINGSIVLLSSTFALAYFPLPKRKVAKKVPAVSESSVGDEEKVQNPPEDTPKLKNPESIVEMDQPKLKNTESLAEMFKAALSYLKSTTFWLIAMASLISLLGYPVFYAFVEKVAIIALEKDPNSSKSHLVPKAIGIANAVGRFVFGFVSSLPYMDPVAMSVVALVVMGVTAITVPDLTEFWHFILAAVAFGLCAAVFVNLRSILVADYMGVNNLNNAFGLCLMFMGVGAEVGIPIGGKLGDMSKAKHVEDRELYRNTFTFAGIALFTGAFLHCPLPFVKYIGKKYKEWKEGRNAEQTPEPLSVDPSDTTQGPSGINSDAPI